MGGPFLTPMEKVVTIIEPLTFFFSFFETMVEDLKLLNQTDF